MSKIVLSFVFTMLCHGLRIEIKNMCPRSDKFCVKMRLEADQSYELEKNVTFPHKKVTFSSSQVYVIPGNFFVVFPEVQFLVLSRCGMTSLEEADFMGAENLQRLELWKNQLETLPSDVFTGARNLEWLDLSSNRIHTLDWKSFHGLRRLKKLLLYKNDIRALPPAIFRDLVSLEALHLEDNYLETLEEDIFATCNRLGIVRIRNNRLKVVHPGIFINMRNLHWLDLSQNYFEEIQTSTLNNLHIKNGRVKRCYINGKIRNLYADNNEIEDLYIQDLTASQEMRLSNNRLNDLSSVSSGKHIIKLDVSQNPLGVINVFDFAFMSNLIFLNLSRTNLRSLGSNTFSRQSNLAILDLSYNNLASIPADILTPLENLRQLYLDHNLLEEVGYENLKISLPALKEVSLTENRWKCAYLRDLVEYMDLNGISLTSGLNGQELGGPHNVAGINCTLVR